jgi:catechol 2,3-dioxygenase-like lactoylglutathione lyase family enzyme
MRLGQVLYPTSDIARAAAFYAAALGLEPDVLDGDRYAAFRLGNTRFALTGGDEDLAGGRVAAAITVSSVVETVSAFERAGALIVLPPEQGHHEVRGVVEDAWGHRTVICGDRF